MADFSMSRQFATIAACQSFEGAYRPTTITRRRTIRLNYGLEKSQQMRGHGNRSCRVAFERKVMPYVKTKDGVEKFYKHWGPKDAQPIVFHHGLLFGARFAPRSAPKVDPSQHSRIH